MNQRECEALEKAGFVSGDAEDFLGLTEEERLEVDLRIRLGRAIRAIREARGMTPRQFARKLKAKVSHVRSVEFGADVGLDTMFRALFSLGGTLDSIERAAPVVATGGTPGRPVGGRRDSRTRGPSAKKTPA